MENELVLNQEDNVHRFLIRVRELKPNCRGLITFPNLFRFVCGSLWVTKQGCWKLMFEARDKGLIEIVPFHGIKVK